MKLLRSFPVVAFAVALLSIASFCVATRQIVFLLIAGAIAAISWYVTEGPRSRTLPKWLANILIIIASVAMAPDLILHPGEVVEVLGRFAIWLMLIKLYERKDRRDYAQVLWLSAILMVGGVMVSSSLLFGAAVVAYGALGVYALLLFQLHASHEAARESRQSEAPPHYRLIPPLRPVIGRATRGQFALTAAVFCVLGLLVSTTVFILFPRGVGTGFLQQIAGRDRDRQGGLADEINLLTSAGSRITDSRTPVMRARIASREGRHVEMPQGLYLRSMTVFNFDPDAFTWSATPIAAAPNPLQGQIASGEVKVLGDFVTNNAVNAALSTTYAIEISPLAHSGDAAFTMLLPLAIESDVAQEYRFNAQTLAIALPANRGLGSYTTYVDPLASESTWRAIVGDRIIGIPETRKYRNPRVRALAVQILNDRSVPLQTPPAYPERGRHARRAAQAIADYFQSGFEYTLDLSDMRISGDPIEQFLFEEKRGHCEFYASAMTAMLQTLGIDARIATGFLGSEYLGDGEYLLRESHAHAWVEVRTGRFEWSTFDPTPPADLAAIHAVEDTLAERVRGIYEMLEVGWMSSIVNFESGAQQDLQESLQLESLQWVDDVVAGAGEWLADVYVRFGWVGALQIGVVGAAVVVATLIVVRLIRRARRIRAALRLEHVRGDEYRRMLRQLGFYIDMLDLLRRGGERKPDWQPPLAFADALAVRRSPAVEPVRELAGLFYRTRYGGCELSADDRARAAALLVRLADSLALRRERQEGPSS